MCAKIYHERSRKPEESLTFLCTVERRDEVLRRISEVIT